MFPLLFFTHLGIVFHLLKHFIPVDAFLISAAGDHHQSNVIRTTSIPDYHVLFLFFFCALCLSCLVFVFRLSVCLCCVCVCLCQCHAPAPWRAWQTVLPTLVTTRIPENRHHFGLHASTPRPTFPTTNHTLTTNERSLFPPQTTWPCHPHQDHPKKHFVKSIQVQLHRQLVDSHPISKAMLISQTSPHAGAHVQQPNSEVYEAEDRCFRVSVARRHRLPHPAAPDPSRHRHSLHQQKRNGADMCRTSGRSPATIATDAGTAAALTSRRTTAPRFTLNKPFQASPVWSSTIPGFFTCLRRRSCQSSFVGSCV